MTSAAIIFAGQDGVPVAGAGQAYLNGWPVYEPGGVPASFADHLGSVPPEYLVPFVAPPTFLPVAGLLSSTGAPVLALQALGCLAFLRALWLLWGRSGWLVVLWVGSFPEMVVALDKAQTAPLLAWAAAALVLGAGSAELGVALALAAAAKGWPVVVVPLLLLHRPRAALISIGLLVALTAAGASYLPEYLAFLPTLAAGSMDPINGAPAYWDPFASLCLLCLLVWVAIVGGRQLPPRRLHGPDGPALAWLLAGLVAPLMWGFYAPATLLVALGLLTDDDGASAALPLGCALSVLCWCAWATDLGWAWACWFALAPTAVVLWGPPRED